MRSHTLTHMYTHIKMKHRVLGKAQCWFTKWQKKSLLLYVCLSMYSLNVFVYWNVEPAFLCPCIIPISRGSIAHVLTCAFVSPQGYLGQCLTQQCGVDVIGVECDPYRVDQGNKRHTNLLSSHIPTSPQHISEPQECHNPGSIKATINHISFDDEIASKFSSSKETSYDAISVSMECANKVTQLSCHCIEHPHSIDEFSLVEPTAKPCGCQPVEKNDKHSTCLTKTARSLQYSKPARFVIKQLLLNFSDLCVQQLDDLVKQSLIPGIY